MSIKILLLEDMNHKAVEISAYLTSLSEVCQEDITTVQDVRGARTELASHFFDLFILDIHVPIRFDAPPAAGSGLALLQSIYHGEISSPRYIVAMTAYADVFRDHKRDFVSRLDSIIHFDPTRSEWKASLADQVMRIVRIKGEEDKTKNKQGYDYDVAIIVALEDLELSAIRKVFPNLEGNRVDRESTEFFEGKATGKNRELRIVAAAAPQMGMPAAACLSMKLINRYKPNYLVMTGIAAGVRGKVSLGDVLIGDPSWDYGSGKWVKDGDNKKFMASPRQLRLDDALRSTFISMKNQYLRLAQIKKAWEAEKPEPELKIHVGALGSGASVIAYSPIVSDILEKNRDLIGLEMEAYSVMYAASVCREPRPRSVIIKSVCDFADEEKDDRYQRYAAYTSAEICKWWIRDYIN